MHLSRRVLFGIKTGLALYAGAVLLPFSVTSWIDGHTFTIFPGWAVVLAWLLLAPLGALAMLHLSRKRFGWLAVILAFPLAAFRYEQDLPRLYGKNLKKTWMSRFDQGAIRIAVSRGEFFVHAEPNENSPTMAMIPENQTVIITGDKGEALKVRLDDGREGYAFKSPNLYDLKKEDFINPKPKDRRP